MSHFQKCQRCGGVSKDGWVLSTDPSCACAKGGLPLPWPTWNKPLRYDVPPYSREEFHALTGTTRARLRIVGSVADEGDVMLHEYVARDARLLATVSAHLHDVLQLKLALWSIKDDLRLLPLPGEQGTTKEDTERYLQLMQDRIDDATGTNDPDAPYCPGCRDVEIGCKQRCFHSCGRDWRCNGCNWPNLRHTCRKFSPPTTPTA